MSERPIIHFAHANGIPAGTYKNLFSKMEAYADVHGIPMLGHNPNYPIEDNWEKLVEELISYIDQLPVKKPIIGIGHSLGASLTYLASKKRPDLFSQVILLDPPMMAGYMSVFYTLIKKLGMTDKFSPAGKSKFRKSFWGNPQAAFDNLSQKKLYANWPEQSLWDYIDSATTSAEMESEAIKLAFLVKNECDIFRTIPGFMDYKKPLQHTLMPTTLVYGSSSDVCTDYIVQRIHKKQGVTLLQVQGGHMFPIESPCEISELIKGLINTQL